MKKNALSVLLADTIRDFELLSSSGAEEQEQTNNLRSLYYDSIQVFILVVYSFMPDALKLKINETTEYRTEVKPNGKEG